MIQLSIKSNASLVRQGLEDLTREIPNIGRQRIYRMMQEARSILATPGAPISYPVNWDNDEQRIKVIIMLKKKGNLPYRRTGRMPKAWKIVKIEQGYRMENDAPAAVYVYGNFEGARQSRIHQGRHPVMQDVLEKKIQELPPEIEKEIGYYARQKGF